MYAAHQFDGLSALLWNQLFGAFNRTGTVDGVAVSLGTSTSAIEFPVGSGTVQVDGASVTVAAQTATVDASSSSLPRRDVIWIDTSGTVQVRRGDPESYEPARDRNGDGTDENTARQTFRPAPDEMDDVLVNDGSPTGVVIATAIIPPWADASTDLTDDDWTERHVRVPSTAGAGSHDDLTGVSANDHHTPPSPQDMIDAAATVFDTVRTMAIPDTTIPAAESATAGHVQVPSGSTAVVTETQVHNADGNSQATLELALVDGAGTDLHTTTSRRDASPSVSLAGADTLTVEIRNTNASGGAEFTGGGHAVIKFV